MLFFHHALALAEPSNTHKNIEKQQEIIRKKW
jgi:hypothetical protein